MRVCVVQLTVEDADHGPNSQVTFTVNTDMFAINSSTGVLYTTQPLDREEKAHYHLTVQATDGGGEAAKVTDYLLGCLIFANSCYSASIQILVSLSTLRLKLILNTRIFSIRYWILYCQTCKKAIQYIENETRELCNGEK